MIETRLSPRIAEDIPPPARCVQLFAPVLGAIRMGLTTIRTRYGERNSKNFSLAAGEQRRMVSPQTKRKSRAGIRLTEIPRILALGCPGLVK